MTTRTEGTLYITPHPPPKNAHPAVTHYFSISIVTARSWRTCWASTRPWAFWTRSRNRRVRCRPKDTPRTLWLDDARRLHRRHRRRDPSPTRVQRSRPASLSSTNGCPNSSWTPSTSLAPKSWVAPDGSCRAFRTRCRCLPAGCPADCWVWRNHLQHKQTKRRNIYFSP